MMVRDSQNFGGAMAVRTVDIERDRSDWKDANASTPHREAARQIAAQLPGSQQSAMGSLLSEPSDSPDDLNR